MSSPTDPARSGSAPSDPAELRRDIEEVRGELADTVDALADKADIKTRAQDKAQELKTQATKKAQELKAQAMEKAPEVRAQATAKAQQAQQVVQVKPGAAVGAALAVLGMLILGRRRRRWKQQRSFSDLVELRRDIEALRGELADTVNVLTERADVRSRGQDKTQELMGQATKKAHKLRGQAIEKPPKLRAQASAKTQQLTGTAQQKAQQAQRVVQKKPRIPAAVMGGVVLVVLGLLFGRRGR